MKIAHVSINMWSLGGLWAAMLCLGQVGCVVTYTTTAVPAARLPAIYQAEPKCGKVPVNFTLLRQEPPKEYLLGPGDQVGVFVKNLVPGGAEPPMVQQAMSTTAEVYPARGLINTPNVGIPYSVNNDGTLILPKVEPVNVAGKTVSQAAATILEAYKATGLLAAGKEEAFVSLLRPRVNRVMVLREDVQANSPQFITKNILPYTRRGTGEVIDLPAYENDVLHVLAASGGLPGIETYNHVWVLKSTSGDRAAEEAQTRIQNGEDAEQVFRALDAKRTAIRIPLRVKPGEPLSFGPQDVILHQGDVVYLETREPEVFYTGGLLPGGEIPLPRDRDIDVMEAIAYANGSVGGPGGISGSSVFRTGAGPGNIVPPTRVLVIRKLPNGQQLTIRCDLTKAKNDPKERIIVQPGDFVMLYYKPGEITSNVLLNFFNFNVLLSPK